MWSVGSNLPGYLPESDIDDYETETGAVDGLLEILERHAESHADVCTEAPNCKECDEFDAAYAAVQDGANQVYVGNSVYWVDQNPG